MKRLLRDIAGMTTQQWLTLISLLVLLNMVVVGGFIWLIATDIAPQQAPFKQVVLAQAAFTRTPYPTFTPDRFAGTSLPLVALTPQPTPTNTRVPTWTPTITPTPPPTDTPTATPPPPPTLPPVPVVQRAAVPPTATFTPTPAVDYLGTVRQLTPCENQGKHHIFVHVQDQNGNGLPEKQVKVMWDGGETMLQTGTKIEDAGLTDFAMYKGTYFVEMVGASSDVLGPISPNIPQDELCPDNGNPVANSLYHYSFEVVFTKVR